MCLQNEWETVVQTCTMQPQQNLSPKVFRVRETVHRTIRPRGWTPQKPNEQVRTCEQEESKSL